ncbi:MAG TPA: VWA domain-containing protein [Thermoanaerobaculia bacterium]|nr:VWA domain-containing protein [Thermoanaerobaculia bacterium]
MTSLPLAWLPGFPTFLVWAVVSLAAPAAPAQQATISAPSEVAVGAEFVVSWTGPGGERDFVSLDPAGAPERQYGPYEYVRKGSRLTFRAPGKPGQYEVRYHSEASGYPVLASAPVRVVAIEAALEVPGTVSVGAPVAITWTGPDNPRDFISIDAEGAREQEYGGYAYTSKGSPLTVAAPAAPGRYLVRYHLGVSGYPVIGTASLTVTEVAATLEVPARAAAGSTIAVTWTGPDNAGDFISIDQVGLPESRYGSYAYTTKGSPLELPVPDQPGSYEVRYHLGASGYRVIGSSPLSVGDVTASVDPVEPVVVGEPFEVSWTGPDNERDFVTIVPAGAPERSYESYAYTRRGNPLRVAAPKSPGSYEVRYLTGQDYRTLASVAVDVRPGSARGSLRVIGAGSGTDAGASASGAGAVEVILDASGSMLQRLGDKRRIELARDALLDLTGSALPAGTPFALRVFGHREAGSCRTDLELPLGPLDPGGAAAKIRSVEAMNLAKTPIAASLRAVRQDLAAASGPRLVVLVTDGEETCDGDPAAAIEELRAAGIEVRVDIVGFAIDELMLKEEFERWARLGGGRYFDAADGDALRQAVRGSLQESYQVLSGTEVVATGTVGGDAVEVAPGRYQVLMSSGRDLGTVTVTAGETTQLRTGG